MGLANHAEGGRILEPCRIRGVLDDTGSAVFTRNGERFGFLMVADHKGLGSFHAQETEGHLCALHLQGAKILQHTRPCLRSFGSFPILPACSKLPAP